VAEAISKKMMYKLSDKEAIRQGISSGKYKQVLSPGQVIVPSLFMTAWLEAYNAQHVEKLTQADLDRMIQLFYTQAKTMAQQRVAAAKSRELQEMLIGAGKWQTSRHNPIRTTQRNAGIYFRPSVQRDNYLQNLKDELKSTKDASRRKQLEDQIKKEEEASYAISDYGPSDIPPKYLSLPLIINGRKYTSVLLAFQDLLKQSLKGFKAPKRPRKRVVNVKADPKGELKKAGEQGAEYLYRDLKPLRPARERVEYVSNLIYTALMQNPPMAQKLLKEKNLPPALQEIKERVRKDPPPLRKAEETERGYEEDDSGYRLQTARERSTEDEEMFKYVLSDARSREMDRLIERARNGDRKASEDLYQRFTQDEIIAKVGEIEQQVDILDTQEMSDEQKDAGTVVNKKKGLQDIEDVTDDPQKIQDFLEAEQKAQAVEAMRLETEWEESITDNMTEEELAQFEQFIEDNKDTMTREQIFILAEKLFLDKKTTAEQATLKQEAAQSELSKEEDSVFKEKEKIGSGKKGALRTELDELSVDLYKISRWLYTLKNHTYLKKTDTQVNKGLRELIYSQTKRKPSVAYQNLLKLDFQFKYIKTMLSRVYKAGFAVVGKEGKLTRVPAIDQKLIRFKLCLRRLITLWMRLSLLAST
jgi:hypothetical protein